MPRGLARTHIELLQAAHVCLAPLPVAGAVVEVELLACPHGRDDCHEQHGHALVIPALDHAHIALPSVGRRAAGAVLRRSSPESLYKTATAHLMSRVTLPTSVAEMTKLMGPAQQT